LSALPIVTIPSYFSAVIDKQLLQSDKVC
jgi:hypothetical protein